MNTLGASWPAWEGRAASDGVPANGDAESLEWPANWHVRVVESTGSTNADLMAAASLGAPDRSVLVAAHQTAGRGRLDRRWEAPPGANLLVSMLFTDLPEHLHELTQRVALAASAAIHVQTGRQAVFKWPNDLLIGREKLAGVLAQAGTRDGRIDHVVIGLGVNVGWAPDGAAKVGDGIHPLVLLRSILDEFDLLPDDVFDLYRGQLATLGSSVRITRPDGDLVGHARGVARDGRLVVVDDSSRTHHVDVGDVVHLRPTETR